MSGPSAAGSSWEVIRRSRVSSDRHGIVAHSTSWIPVRYGELIPQLTSSERLTGRTSLQLIAEATGRPTTPGIDTTSARRSPRRTPSSWSWAPREPVAVMTAKFVDSEGTVVE
ncbi:hypothetical protein ACFXDP_29785 [Streptomyces sp. NPDC059374]|uniref:hypothetical protein n=1 Tax=Streptomyces sp. NPDC059374 TaxID=3346814 RepID=UPI0036BAE4F3